MDVIEELKSFWEKFTKKKIQGGGSVWGGGGGQGVGGGGQGGCEQRIEVFVKIKKKKNWLGRVGGGGGLGWRGRVGGGSGWM